MYVIGKNQCPKCLSLYCNTIENDNGDKIFTCHSCNHTINKTQLKKAIPITMEFIIEERKKYRDSLRNGGLHGY